MQLGKPVASQGDFGALCAFGLRVSSYIAATDELSSCYDHCLQRRVAALVQSLKSKLRYLASGM